MRSTAALWVFVLCVAPLGAWELRCAGILGNSGEQGAALVRFDGRTASGIGVVADRYGSLWDRAGAGVLNRYAVDGRLLASYPVPGGAGTRGKDAMVLLDDTIILRLERGLYALPIDAPSGTEATSLDIEADWMSLSAHDGWVAASRGVDVFKVNAASEVQAVTTLDKAPGQGLAFGADGSIHIVRDWQVYRVSGADEAGLVRVGAAPGERPQFVDGFWYAHGWHSTVRRFDAALQPAPGVVLGGNSGSFIGHVAEQSEVVNGRGMARVGPDLFAVSGFGGVLHLLAWDGAAQRFDPVRRIGAMPSCAALALDREGRIWYGSGNWRWTDGPATPLRNGVPAPERIFGLAMQERDALVGYGRMWGKPMIAFGTLDKEVRLQRIEEASDLPADAVGVTVGRHDGKRSLLVLSKDGALTAIRIGGNGEYGGEARTVELVTSTPVAEWTSLASAGSDTLLAGGDGFVICLSRDGETWKESDRWNAWGDSPEDLLGGTIFVSFDAGRLWVSDTTRHRVLCLSRVDRTLIAEYGERDRPGDDLAHVDSPRVIAGRGSRAVVWDSRNQRVVRLTLVE